MPLDFIQERARAQSPETQGLVAMVTNVGGAAILNSVDGAISSKEVALQDTFVYGDRIITNENSVLSMLVGDDALVCMEEFSNIAIEQGANGGQLIQLVSGRACISTIGKEEGNTDLSVKTPTAIIRPAPGTLFSVAVSHPTMEEAQKPASPRAILTGFSEKGSLFAPTWVSHSSELGIETIQVIQGSVEVVTQVPGVEPVVVLQGFQVTLREGVIGQLVKDTAVQCQIQDLQKTPQHTRNTKEIQGLIAEQQSAQATHLVAALFSPQGQSNTELVDTNKQGIILPSEQGPDLNGNGNGNGNSNGDDTINSPVLSVTGGDGSLPRESRLTTIDAGVSLPIALGPPPRRILCKS
jgi:hypothetical protein